IRPRDRARRGGAHLDRAPHAARLRRALALHLRVERIGRIGRLGRIARVARVARVARGARVARAVVCARGARDDERRERREQRERECVTASIMAPVHAKAGAMRRLLVTVMMLSSLACDKDEKAKQLAESVAGDAAVPSATVATAAPAATD